MVSATQLYGPYGSVRYQSGTLPTSYGYTHQRSDAVSGLDYYNARSYDPLAGQFTSADSVRAGGLNRYAYVGGSPESAIDPSGHIPVTQTRDYRPVLAYQQWSAQPNHTYYGSVGAFFRDTAQFFLGTDTLSQSYHTLFQDPHASAGDKLKAAGVAAVTIATDAVVIGSTFVGDPEIGEAARTADEALLAAEEAERAAAVAANVTTDAATVVGAGNNETVDLYRAVGVREYNSVMQSGRFEPGANSLEGRQFALSNDEALAFARADLSKVAILKATLPTEALQYFDFSMDIDPTIFRQGVVTVQPGEQSAIFHQLLISINEVP